MAEIQVNLNANDQLTPAFFRAMEASGNLNAALQKLLVQDQVNKTMAEAQSVFNGMSDVERKSALAAMEFDQAQRKAADSITNLNKAVVPQKGLLDNLKSGLAEVIEKTTGMSMAQFTAVGAVTALAGGLIKLGKAAVDTVKDYSAYVESIDKMSMKTGVAVDDLSRLVQVADDFRVEQSTMTAAMDMAVQNGFVPSIDNLARLADKLQGIQNPIERSNELQAIFGRQWKEIYPLLERGGDAIRNAAAGIADGLVVTQAAIDKNRELQKSLDDIGDAWTAVKYAAVQANATEIGGSISIFAENITDLSNGVSIFEVLAKNQEKYAELDKKIVAEKQLRADASRLAADGERYQAQAAAYLADQSGDLAKQGGKVAEVFTDEADKAKWYAIAQKALAENSVDVVSSMRGTAQTANLTSGQMENLTEAEIRNREATIKASDAYKNLRQAQDNLATAQQNFNQNYTQNAIQGLEGLGVSAAKMMAAYEAIDARYNTQYAAQAKAEQKQKELDKAYAAGTITADEYAQGLQDQQPAWESLDKNIKTTADALEDAKTKFNNFIASLAGANGAHFAAYIDIVTSGSGGGGSRDQGRKKQVNVGNGQVVAPTPDFASGGSFTIPAEYGYEGFNLGGMATASAGERVTITPANEVIGGTYSAGGPMTNSTGAPVEQTVIQVTQIISERIDEEAMTARLLERIRRRR